MSLRYSWLVGGMEGRSENTLEFRISDEKSGCLSVVSCFHTYTSFLCLSETVVQEQATVTVHEKCCGCVWFSKKCLKVKHSGNKLLVLSLLTFSEQSRCPEILKKHGCFLVIATPLDRIGSRSCNGSYVTLVSGMLCPCQLVVPISYCSINGRVRRRLLHSVFTLWRSFLPRQLCNLFLLVALWYILQFFSLSFV